MNNLGARKAAATLGRPPNPARSPSHVTGLLVRTHLTRGENREEAGRPGGSGSPSRLVILTC